MFSRSAVPVGLAAILALPVAAQQMPNTQPAIIGITREIEKPGHFGLHEAVEIRWADLSRRSNYPYGYLALVANSGVAEVWWVTAYDGLGSFGKGATFGSDNPAYTQALSKIAAEDGEHLNNVIFTQAQAVPDASYGTFPDVSKMRVFSVLTVQMRPGMEPMFAEIAKKYAGIMQAKGVPTSWRAYEVIAGAPGGSYLVFSSYPSWDAVEAERKASMAAFMGANPTDLEGIMKASREAVVSTNARYFTVNPRMSLVPKEWASDPFWAPKKTTP
ncbi:MAG TPA: hypothetical protein VGA42_06810 [Gemmatimonadales bacterium]